MNTAIRRYDRALTLVELLVVIAIIVVLAGLMFPVFQFVREKGRQVTCTSNQRQIALAIMMAAQDNQETLPDSASVWQQISVDAKLKRCPSTSEQVNGYVYNNAISGLRLAVIPNHTTTFTVTDGKHQANNDGTVDNVAYETSDCDLRHNGGLVVGYLDGHAAYTKAAPL
ncbi:MAG: type II secretion system protein [Armatimonadota bacterium]